MKSSNSRMKMMMEGVRPRLSTIIDGRTCCIVRGLFPYLILLVQNAVSSKWPRHVGEVLISFSIFWHTPVSSQEEIATWKSRWNSNWVAVKMFMSIVHNRIAPLFSCLQRAWFWNHKSILPYVHLLFARILLTKHAFVACHFTIKRDIFQFNHPKIS